MREVRFRAWIPSEKRIGGTFTLREVANEDGTFDDDVIFLESTGLEDKNGKEIFEGDIIKAIANFYQKETIIEPAKIWWMPNSAMFGVYGWGDRNITDFIQIEIIGNIYENPELLKGQL